MCIAYFFSSCKLATSFSTFSIFILLVKVANHYEDNVNFQDIEYQLQENTLYHFLHYSFL